ncbi:MAG: hypothetical protein M3384_04005 [Acidobacteriota bacterium]|nr:hypothetical protein [Acidobacteriota bacterium]
MRHFILIILIGAFAVVIFDTLGSLTSRRFGFPYHWLTIGSFLIYAAVGFAASKSNGLTSAPLAGGITSLVDSTLGWYISWIIGPGRPAIKMDSNVIFLMVVFITLTGAVVGFIGGLIGRVI